MFLQKSFKYADLLYFIIINDKNRCAASYFCGNLFFFLLDSLMKIKHLFEIEIFRNIIDAFPVTFKQFNVYVLNKTINFFKKNYVPQTFER